MVQKVKDWIKKPVSTKYPKLTNGYTVLIVIGTVLLIPLYKAIVGKKK